MNTSYSRRSAPEGIELGQRERPRARAKPGTGAGRIRMARAALDGPTPVSLLRWPSRRSAGMTGVTKMRLW